MAKGSYGVYMARLRRESPVAQLESSTKSNSCFGWKPTLPAERPSHLRMQIGDGSRFVTPVIFGDGRRILPRSALMFFRPC
jgi:hypothetical protein